MEIVEATRRYEKWLGGFMPLVATDLRRKHQRMTETPFLFMRATFYRWCQLWKALPAIERAGRAVLAVGDLHVENFGSWRDAEGRLVWGINDFDEATTLPWTQDLVRLVTSAHIAIADRHLALPARRASECVLEGYRDALARGGEPFVLEENNRWLRRIATGELRDPVAFWARLGTLPVARTVPARVRTILATALPGAGAPSLRFARRVAGIGSLGRPRFVGITRWCGGEVAREAKAMAPSAWRWAAGREAPAAIEYDRIRARAVRVPDPTVHLAGDWLVRRLAPHCSRIDLDDLPRRRDEERLLYAMGFETANVHLGTRGATRAIRAELRGRSPRWLHQLARQLARAIHDDWRLWRAGTSRDGA